MKADSIPEKTVAMFKGFSFYHSGLIVVAILFSCSVWALDNRVLVEFFEFATPPKTYQLVTIRIDPNARDDSEMTELEFARWMYVESLVRDTQKFLRDLHSEDVAQNNRSGALADLILGSFVQFPDPFGRLKYSDSGRPLHKVDDYFSRRSLIAVLLEMHLQESPTIVATAKFVVADPTRLFAPLVQDYSGFVPLPFATPDSPHQLLQVEFENLAKSPVIPSPIPLLLNRMSQDSFFDSLLAETDTSFVHLNCEDRFVNYHRRFGLEVIPNFYAGMAAQRMRGKLATFLKHARESTRIALAKRSTLLLNPTRGRFLPEAISMYESNSCRRFLVQRVR